MREALLLSSPERRIGLSAHDFAQAAGAGDLLLITTARRGGAPATPSRWLWRLQTLVKGAGLAMPERADLLAWARALDAPGRLDPAERPRPTPPVAARPRKLPVTSDRAAGCATPTPSTLAMCSACARWSGPPSRSRRGRAGRRCTGRSSASRKNRPDLDGADAEMLFENLVVEELIRAGMPGPALARERALARLAAPDAVRLDRRRRQGAVLLLEQNGETTIDAPGGPFILTARADRIEARGARADVLDFKTGRLPTGREMRSGLSPQLTLTAAILARGGFADAGRVQPGQLVYVRVLSARHGVQEEARSEAGDSAGAGRAGARRPEPTDRELRRPADRRTSHGRRRSSSTSSTATTTTWRASGNGT